MDMNLLAYVSTVIFLRIHNRMITWFPNTPMLQALLTWSGPNQTAANRAGTERMKVWLRATIEWPRNVTQNLSGETLNTFIQAPAAVPTAPNIAAYLRPWNEGIQQKNYI